MGLTTNISIFFILFYIAFFYNLHKASIPLEPCHPKSPSSSSSSASNDNNCIEPLLYHYKSNVANEGKSHNDNTNIDTNKSTTHPSLFLLELYVSSIVSSPQMKSSRSRSSSSPTRFQWELVSTCSPSSSSSSSSSSQQSQEEEGMFFHFNNNLKAVEAETTTATVDTSKLIRTACNITIPDFSRIRKVHRKDMHLLKGKFVLKQILTTNNSNINEKEEKEEALTRTSTINDEKQSINKSNKRKNTNRNRKDVVIAETIFDLTRIIYKKTSYGKNHNHNHNHNQNDHHSQSPHVPQYKYMRQPIVLRIVTDSQLYPLHSGPIRGDGNRMEITSAAALGVYDNNNNNAHYNKRWDNDHERRNRFQRLLYRPIFYVDDIALRHSSQIELGPPQILSNNSSSSSSSELSSEPKPPVTLNINISFITPFRHVIQDLLFLTISMVESTNILQPSELDEMRYFLSDKYMYKFVITQVIGMIHLFIEYLAFSSEIQFYVDRKKSDNMTGISLSSLYSRCICDVIILLYLLDGDGNTSWFVLCGIASGILVSLWKLYQFLQPKFHWNWKISSGSSGSNNSENDGCRIQLPFISFRDSSTMSTTEQLTVDYDTIARTYLSLILYPMIFGLALYGRQFYVYKSFYSWMISNLANAVYTFGFISLCPQLYINYRLKSVAHLPWKVFVYKIFNTFVDDVFAFLVEMPTKHKIMTLRDDVVFVIFLVQAYMYRVDKMRVNEYGYAYEEEDEHNGDERERQYKEKSSIHRNANKTVQGLEKKEADKDHLRDVDSKLVKVD